MGLSPHRSNNNHGAATMKALTNEQAYLLNSLTPGQKAIVITSQHIDNAFVRKNLEQRGEPNTEILRGSSQSVRGLIKRGLLKGECIWRGYRVERTAA
jgi:hypothetical protein